MFIKNKNLIFFVEEIMSSCETATFVLWGILFECFDYELTLLRCWQRASGSYQLEFRMENYEDTLPRIHNAYYLNQDYSSMVGKRFIKN